MLGIAFPTALGLIFITLKLTGSIAWSWAWILSPFWLPWFLVLLLGFTQAMLEALSDQRTPGPRKRG